MSKNDFSKGAENALAVTFSPSGYVLTDAEKSLFREANPFGFILFARNCETPEQLHGLCSDLRELVGRDCPILIDQEGGRVQRLRAPQWRDFQSFQSFGEVFEGDASKGLEALRFETLRLSEGLVDAGITVNCSPVLDLYFEDAHDIIGDRAFSADPQVVSRLGLSVCRHFLAAGITPVIKHIPGHGRAKADSHLELPVVDTPHAEMAQSDFIPFKALSESDVGHAVWGMTAHIVYSDLDQDLPATLSENVISEVIRGEIGFDGFLVGDDLDMKALEPYGDLSERAQRTLAAGCDLALYCAGEFEKMEKLAENTPKMALEALKRLQRAAENGKVAA